MKNVYLVKITKKTQFSLNASIKNLTIYSIFLSYEWKTLEKVYNKKIYFIKLIKKMF